MNCLHFHTIKLINNVIHQTDILLQLCSFREIISTPTYTYIWCTVVILNFMECGWINIFPVSFII